MAKEQLTELSSIDEEQIKSMFTYNGTTLKQNQTGVKIGYTTNVANNDYDYSRVNFIMYITYRANNQWREQTLNLYRDKNNDLIQYGAMITLVVDSAPNITLRAFTYYNGDFKNYIKSVSITS